MNRITFEQFIKTFNFRDYAGYNSAFKKDVYDTKIIRIYLPINEEVNSKDSDWFEFGIYDFTEKEYMWNLCKIIFNDNILKSYVSGIQYNVYDSGLSLQIYLSKESKGE